MKLDLVMWTYNSEKTLSYTLNSIKKAIPEKFINQKIIVDGGSNDRTALIADFFKWNFIKSKRKGIPFQANTALELVETDIFASFEHDIVLCPNWFYLIKNKLDNDKVAVAQGVRLSTNKALRAIEKYGLLEDYIRYSSIDNNIYKTKIIKDLGGFDEKFIVSTDRKLQDKIKENGYKWLICKNIISDHLKPSVRKSAKHYQKNHLLRDYKEDFKPVFLYSKVKIKSEKRLEFLDSLSKLFSSFIIGFVIARKYKIPEVTYCYPYWRLKKLQTAIKVNMYE